MTGGGVFGPVSDPDLVKEHLAAAQTRELSIQEAEPAGVGQAWDKLEGQFLQHLDLLNREVLTEAEFEKANDAARRQGTALDPGRGCRPSGR